MRQWPRGELWRDPLFLNLWGAQAVSALGTRITRTALPVLAVLTVGGSPFEMAALSALGVAPGALVGLLCGGYIDRSAKRPLLIGADLLRAGLVLLIPIVAWYDALQMVHLYLVASVMGCATTLFQITDNAYLPALLEEKHLGAANAHLEATESVAEISGPALAGLLIDWLTAPFTLILDSLSYLGSAFLLARIKKEESPAPALESQTLLADIRIGWQTVWNITEVRALLLASAGMTVSWGFFLALYMVYTLDQLSLSPGVVGLVIGVGGAGGLLGAVFSERTARRFGTGGAMLLCAFAAMASALLIPLAGGSSITIIACLVGHQLLGDGFLVAYEIQAVSLRQKAVPLQLLARTNGVFTVVRTILLPLGALAAGALAELWGVRVAITTGVALGMLAPLALLPLRRLQHHSS